MENNIYLGIILSLFVTGTFAGENCTMYNDYGDGDETYMYCGTSCCGDSYGRYCCGSDSLEGFIIGLIVFGVLAALVIVVTMLVVVFCCCRKTRGQTGQVCQPVGVTTTVPVYGVQTTTMTAGYGQAGHTNTAFPQQMQTVSGNSPQTCREPPPPYSSVVANFA